MRITIRSGISGARQAQGLAVLIDVFRGSSTIVALFVEGARHVFPVAFSREARRLKRKNPHYILVGETKGKPPTGFDCGNSPFEVSRLNLRGKDVIFRSSAASRGILEACHKAAISELLIGGFVNANSIATYIKEKMPKQVTLIAIGTLGFGTWRKAAEDEKCAQYIENLLTNKEANFSKMKNEILGEDGAARLIKLGQVRDMMICLSLDMFDGIIPIVTKTSLRYTQNPKIRLFSLPSLL